MALIALFQSSSRHHDTSLDTAALSLSFSTEQNKICFSPWLLWASECSIMHSTSHCSSSLSPIRVSLPTCDLSFLWPRWTRLVWPRPSLEEWDGEGGALCHLQHSLLCAPLRRKHAQCFHVRATLSLRCARAIRKHRVITVLPAVLESFCFWAGLVFAELWFFFPVGKRQWLVKILFLALYCVDYILDAAETKTMSWLLNVCC